MHIIRPACSRLTHFILYCGIFMRRYAPFMPTSQKRRAALRDILVEHAPSTQTEVQVLLQQSGFDSTQPVISRDLRALGAIKRNGAYALPPDEHVTPLQTLSALLRGSAPAGPHLTVVYCEAGAANAIARAFEAEGMEGVVGTIAGDDTVFVAVRSAAAGEAVRRHIEALV